MKTLTTADDRVSGAGHLQPIDRYARPLPLARNAAGGTGSSSKLKYDGRQFQVLDHRSRAALPEADPLRCSISRGRSHPPTAGSSASETPAFPPTGASLYSCIRDFCSRCRGGVRIVQIATGWRFGSSNSRSLRSRLHHRRARETASQMALPLQGKMSLLPGRSAHVEIVIWRGMIFAAVLSVK